MRAALVRVTLAAALCLSVTGCADDSPAPKPYSGPSKSATPSGAPSMPAAAKGTTEASAKAFVEFYLHAVTYAAKTGDTSAVKDLGAASCLTCKNILGEVDKIYTAGGSVDSTSYSSEELHVAKSGSQSLLLEGTVVLGKEVKTVSAGAEPTTSAAANVSSRFTLTRSDNQWQLQNWQLL